MEAMENNYYRDIIKEFELPPGFRFHPTDEELITHYLSQKVLDSYFCARAIGEVDLNKCEPWDLPCKAKMGEKEWYFFCVRDRKYPTGLRTNRATDAGYWKATGKDKEIYRANTLIGMKKTLVFYKGRAPKGEKTNWVMHEYRLEDKHSRHNLPKTTMNDWAICRVFQKRSCGKKMHISGVERFNSFGKELPQLMESSPHNNSEITKTAFGDSTQSEEDQRTQEDDKVAPSYSLNQSDISTVSWPFTKFAPTGSHQSTYQMGNSQCSNYLMEQSMLRMLIENHGSSTKPRDHKAKERDFDADISSVMYNNNEIMFQNTYGNQEYSSATVGDVDTGCLWDF